MGVCVQRTRVIGYVDPDTVTQIEELEQYTKSGFVREAIREKLEREANV